MRSRTPLGSLPARIYLLAYDVDKGKLSGSQLQLLVRGAVLAELILRGCLAEQDDGKVRATGTERTGDEPLDAVLRVVSEAGPRSWRWWVRKGARQTFRAVQQQLVSADVISVEQDRALGIFPIQRVTVRQPDRIAALRAPLLAAVSGSGRVSTEDAVAVALVNVGELNTALSRKDRKAHAKRIKQLTDEAGAVVPALPKVLRQIKAARAEAQAAG